MTITKMYKVTAFSCRFWRKCNFACEGPKSKNENVACEVYEKPDVMKFIPQDTEKLPPFNHDDLLDVQYLHLT